MPDVMRELQGKRLLILGGSLWKNAISSFCRENGITIIAAGNDPNAGICDIAEEYYNVNSTDAAVMKKLITDKKIDGVYMGGNEPVIARACQYIGELGLPCYCNKKQWDALQDKKQFKAICVQSGLPVVREFERDSVTDKDYPVVTKPVDGCASKGFSVCHNREELQAGAAAAAAASPTGRYIVEQYVPNDGIVVLYTVSRGKLVFSAIEDKYPVYFEKYGTYVGGLFDFESALADEFRALFEEKLQRMITALDIQEGNFWIEVFHDRDRYYFNEAGFRYGGSGSLYPVDYFRGINQVAADIYYALTGKSRITGFTPLYGEEVVHGKRYAVYPVYVRSGVIGKVDGLGTILGMPNVLNILTMKKAGDSIPDNGSFGQVVVLVHLIYSNCRELTDFLAQIHSSISVKDENGEDMVLQLLDTENFTLRQ